MDTTREHKSDSSDSPDSIYLSRFPHIVYTASTDSGRDITVIQGNSGIIYPFYCSTGLQSSQKGTWFPWMGYFESHPEEVNQLYMAKPKTVREEPLLPEEIVRLFSTHKDKEVRDVFPRMGNVETLMISCSIGGGIWDKYPDLRKTLLESDYNRYAMNITTVPTETIRGSGSSSEVDTFQGAAYRGKEGVQAYESHIVIAKKMETFIENQSREYPIRTGFVQNMPLFPSHEMLVNYEVEQLDLKRNLERLAADLLEKCSAKSAKIDLITRLSALVPKAESLHEIANIFELMTKVSLQRTDNKHSLFSTSSIGSHLEKVMTQPAYQKLKALFFNKEKVEYSDLRKLVSADKAHFNSANCKTNFDEINKEITALEERAVGKRKLSYSL